VLRGGFAIAFGLAVFKMPGVALVTFIYLFGAYAMADGIAALAALVTGRHTDAWWSLAIGGVAGIIAGLLTFAMPGMTTLGLLAMIAARAFVTGLVEIVAAVQLRHEIHEVWVLAVAGALSIGAAVAMAVVPSIGALALSWLIGTYAIMFGAVAIAFGITMKQQPELMPATPRLRHTMAPPIEERELERR
jgi:uncharacterized membrane protein HdeD (DUF308 family)